MEARALAVNKLRSRVREQALANAPDWLLTRATVVNNTMISLYERKRPRGDFLNVKMDGMVGEGPKQFISSILSMTKRRQWEGTFEDGVVVEGIDIGESTSVLTKEDEVISPGSSPMPTQSPIQTMTSNDATVSVAAAAEESTPSLPESSLKQLQNTKVARKTDDVLTFLTTVDLAGVPPGMAIAFLNDPERQHALAHLRKQMMLSNPEECMLCQSPFETAASIRFCPCCAMVSCSRCVSKRVFEVVSRQVVSVCVHCFRESSRVRHPPQAVQDTSGIDESLRGKWWRPEELGIVDYSHSRPRTMSQLAEIEDAGDADMFGDPESTVGSRAVREESSMYNDLDQLVLQKEDLQTLRPLVPGILDGLFDNNQTDANNENSRDLESPAELTKKNSTRSASPVPISNITSAINSVAKKAFSSIANKKPTDDLGAASPSSSGSSAGAAKTARCKNCGLLISRDMDAIEAHMEECTGVAENSAKRTSSTISGIRNRFRSNTSPAPDLRSFHINEKDGSMVVSHGTSKSFGGIRRSTERNAYGTRVIYRTARSNVKAVRPREVCAFQDSFIDDDGTCYAYEVSVRHCDARGLPDYVTADVLLLLYAARPVPGSKSMSNITIISQVDTRSRSPQWLLSFMMDDNMGKVGVLGKEDLVRELKQCGNLQNILQNDRQQTLDAEEGQAASLSDFELLAVLGRGGFGKVMQVRHIPSGEVYAMKILKKSELRRRRQVSKLCKCVLEVLEI